MKSIDKASKKQKKEYFDQFREEWEINPETRKEWDKKAARHKKEREDRESREDELYGH